MKCSKCGTMLPDDAKFCASCGSRVEAPTTEASVSEAPGPAGAEQADSPQPEVIAIAEPIEEAALDETAAEAPPAVNPIIETPPAVNPVVETPPAAPVCRQCGNQLKPGSQFCNKCGTRVSPAVTAPVLPPVQSATPKDNFCPRCANKVRPDATFCPSCGTRLTPAGGQAAGFAAAPQAQPRQTFQQAPPYPVYAAQPTYSQYPNPYQQAPARPKRKKGWLVALIVILVIVLAGGGTYMLFGKQLRRSVMGPRAAYLEIEGNTLKSNTADLVKTVVKYGNKDTNEKGGFNMDLQLSLDAAALELDPEISTVFEKLRLSNELVFDRTGDSPQVYNKLELLSLTEHLVDIELLYDGDELVIRAPEVFDEYLVTAVSGLEDTFGSSGISIGDIDMSELSSYAGLLTGTGDLDLGIDEKAMNKTTGEVVNIILRHIDECELKKGETLTVGSVSAEYDLYEMSISKESARAMIIEILEFLQHDEEFYNLYSQLSGVFGDETGSESGELTMEQYQSDIQSAIDDVSDETNDTGDFTIHQLVYVDSADEVVGRILTVIDDTDTTQLKIEYKNPADGNREGYLLAVDTGTETFSFLADYTVSGDRKSGTATLSSMGTDMLTIDFTDYVHEETDESDKILGRFECAIVDPDSITEGMPSEFVIDISEAGGQTVFKVSIPDMLDLNLSLAEIADRDVQIPSFDDGAPRVDLSDSTAMESVMDTEAQDKIMAIMEKLGIDTSGME